MTALIIEDWEVQDLTLDCITQEDPATLSPKNEVSPTKEVSPKNEVLPTKEVLPKNEVLPIEVSEEVPKCAEDSSVTPIGFIKTLLIKSQKKFQAQRELPHFKRTIRMYNIERDIHIPKTEIIREILAERAIIVNGVIDWKGAGSLRRFNPEDATLKDSTRWVIKSCKDLNKQFVVHSDIHVEVTKSQKKRGITRPY